MKKFLLFAAVAGFGSLTLSSYQDGPALHSYNRTGAKNSSTTCGGGGCHGTGSGTTVNIELDSAGTPVTSYKPGMSYTVKITGSNTSGLSKFGFEFASVSGSSSQIQAGTASGFPANVGGDALSGLTIVEQHASLNAVTAGSYSVSFNWTAPVASTGTVTMYCTLNAVNGNGDNDGGDISGNTHITLAEQTGGVGVRNIAEEMNISAYPNPASSRLNLKIENATIGTYTISVLDISGKKIMAEDIIVNTSAYNKSINTASWAPGLYTVQIAKDGAQKIIQVVKQ